MPLNELGRDRFERVRPALPLSLLRGLLSVGGINAAFDLASIRLSLPASLSER